jgi:hypothetical protein
LQHLPEREGVKLQTNEKKGVKSLHLTTQIFKLLILFKKKRKKKPQKTPPILGGMLFSIFAFLKMIKVFFCVLVFPLSLRRFSIKI